MRTPKKKNYNKHSVHSAQQKHKGKREQTQESSTSASDDGVALIKQVHFEKSRVHPIKDKKKLKHKSVQGKEKIVYLLNQLLNDSSSEDSGSEGSHINKFDGVKVQSRTTYYRSNVRAASKDLKSIAFKEGHIAAIKKTPFWLLFNSLYNTSSKLIKKQCLKYEEDIRCVMTSYHMKTESFLIGGELRKMTKIDVQLILGVVGGSKDIPLNCSDYVVPVWVMRCFESSESQKGPPGTYQLYKVYILDRLKSEIVRDFEEGYKDVARLVHCYLLAALLAPTKNGSINWHVTCCCENFEDMFNFDWCDYILRVLMDQIKRSRSLRAGGCAMLLLYWLCEFTTLITPVEDSGIPRYLKWDLSMLNKKLKGKDLCMLKAKYIRCREIRKTNEEKAVFKLLVSELSMEYNRYLHDIGAESPTARNLSVALSTEFVNERRQQASPAETSDTDIVDTYNLSCGDNEGNRITPSSSRSERWRARSEKKLRGEGTSRGKTKERSTSQVNKACDSGNIKINNKSSGHLALENDIEVVMNTPEADLEKLKNQAAENLILLNEGSNGEVVKHGGEKHEEGGSVRKNLLGHFDKGEKRSQECENERSNVGVDNDEKACIEPNYTIRPVYSLGFGFSKYDQEHSGDGDVDLGSVLKKINEKEGMIGNQVDGGGCHDKLDESHCCLIPSIEDIRQQLREQECQLKELKEKLRTSNNKNEALTKCMPMTVNRQVEEALKAERSKMTAEFKEILAKKDMEIDGLKAVIVDLNTRLNAEMNPTDTQVITKESNLRLIDALEKVYTTEKKYDKLEAAHNNLAETLELYEGGEAEAASAEGMLTPVEALAATPEEESGKRHKEGAGKEISTVAAGEEDTDVRGCAAVQKGSCSKGNVGSDITSVVDKVQQSPGKELQTNVRISPCVRRVRSKRKVSPTSMVRRIKGRTDLGDRSKIVISPQPTTGELINIDDTDAIATDAVEGAMKDNIGPLPLNKKCRPVKETKESTIEDMEECWEASQERAVIWKAPDSVYLDVCLSDILAILHDGRISNAVVDAWGKILLAKYATSAGATRTVVFLSSSWDLIHHYGGKGKHNLLEKNVDKRLQSEVGKDFVLLFPMLTSGKGRHEVGDHWTLLQFDVASGRWYFYNSMETRTSATEDVHMTRSMTLIDYVEKKLRDVFKSKFPKHFLIEKQNTTLPLRADCPQQISGTLDCGVVLCDNMEQIVSRKEIKKGKYKLVNAASYRAKMVEWLMDWEEVDY